MAGAPTKFSFRSTLGNRPGEADTRAEESSERVNVICRPGGSVRLASGRLMNDDVSAEQKAAAIRHRRSGQTLAGYAGATHFREQGIDLAERPV
jgi:hypothetical protein